MPLPQNINSKYLLRLQQVARYRLTGRLQDKQIAFLTGLTVPELLKILTTPEYLELEASMMEGHISKMDQGLAEDAAAMQEHFKAAVPIAMRTLMETVQQRKDLKSALAAAKEILDRDPQQTFAVHKVAGPAAGNGQGFNPGASTEVLAQVTVDGAKVSAELRAQPSNLAATVSGMSNNGAKRNPEDEGQGS